MFQSNTTIQFDWAHNYLTTHGYDIKKKAHPIREMPWSQVYVIETMQGKIYLKSMAPPFANEPTLLKFLNLHVSQQVPELIASNAEYACFLMKDNGTPLRGLLKNHYNLQYICQALLAYADIQIGCISYVEQLLSLGVNDWRLKNMTHLYQNFIDQKEILKSEGLQDLEVAQLNKLTKDVEILTQKLIAFGIPETLEHGDFQDNNILVDGDSITINDWGDASITHPFFSCVGFLHSAKRNHGLSESSPNYIHAKKVYLDKWCAFAPENKILEAFELSKVIHHFVFALSFTRIKSCAGIEEFPEYNGYIANALRDFINCFLKK